MSLRIRQIVLAARELDPTVDALQAVLGVGAAFRDPGVAEFGLDNAVMPIGDQFLEVVSPLRPALMMETPRRVESTDTKS